MPWAGTPLLALRPCTDDGHGRCPMMKPNNTTFGFINIKPPKKQKNFRPPGLSCKAKWHTNVKRAKSLTSFGVTLAF